MIVTVEPYDDTHREPLRAQLSEAGLIGRPGDVDKFWSDLLAEPYRCNSHVLVARDDKGVVHGIILADGRPYGREGARHLMLWVAEGVRRRGIGSQLTAAVGKCLAEDGVPVMFIGIYDGFEDIVPFLEAQGFEPAGRDLRIAWGGGDYSYKPVDGVRCLEYRDGGDGELNERIATFQNRAFANEPLVPHMTGESIEYILAAQKRWMMVAIEEETGEVVGTTECTDSNLFPSIAVARRYWARGLAEWIGGLALDRYIEAGFTSPWTIARPENRASVAYLKRMNWHPVGACTHYAASTSMGR